MGETLLNGSCIYKIENIINGKIYFGKTKKFSRRKNEYNHGDFSNNHLANAVAKYGWENFSINPFIVCDKGMLNSCKGYIFEFVKEN